MLLNQGKYDEVQVTIERWAQKFPGNPGPGRRRVHLASAQRDYEVAGEEARALRESQATSLMWRAGTSAMLAQVAQLRGRLAEAERHWGDAMDAYARLDRPVAHLRRAMDQAYLDVYYRKAGDRALEVLESALARYSLDSIPPVSRPYLWDYTAQLSGLVPLYALAGQPESALALLTEVETSVDPELRRRDEPARRAIEALSTDR